MVGHRKGGTAEPPKELLKQAHRVLNSLKDERTSLLLSILIETGARISEAVTLKQDALTDQTLRIDGKHSRKLTVSIELSKKIKKYTEQHQKQYIFFSEQRPHMSEERARQLLKPHKISAREIRKSVVESKKLSPEKKKKRFGYVRPPKTKPTETDIRKIQENLPQISPEIRAVVKKLLTTDNSIEELVKGTSLHPRATRIHIHNFLDSIGLHHIRARNLKGVRFK